MKKSDKKAYISNWALVFISYSILSTFVIMGILLEYRTTEDINISIPYQCNLTERIIYRDITTVNISTNMNSINASTMVINNVTNFTCEQVYSTKYVLNLIKQVKECEYELNWLNKTDYKTEYDKVNESLNRCNKKINKIEEVLK